MTLLTDPLPAFPLRHHRAATTAALVTLFWSIAALIVLAIHRSLDRSAPVAATALTIGTLLLAAFAYSILAARQAGISHALGVGIAWLLLAMLTEMMVTTRLHHGWFSLLGSPQYPLLRNIQLFAWIFAPALFARGDAEADDRAER
jgi:hypothetical protein